MSWGDLFVGLLLVAMIVLTILGAFLAYLGGRAAREIEIIREDAAKTLARREGNRVKHDQQSNEPMSHEQ